MNNEKKEFFKNDVEVDVGGEEIVLAPPTELINEAKEIAQRRKSDEKFPFYLQYDVNQKEFLMSMLQTVGAVVEKDDEENYTLSTKMNMAQLAFIKRLDCVERVSTNEGMNSLLVEEAVKLTPIQQEDEVLDDEVKVAVTDIDTESLGIQAEIALNRPVDTNLKGVEITESDQTNGDIAVASVTATPRSSCCPCPTNTDMAHAQCITVETLINGFICCPGAEQWFKFTVPETKKYTIFTMGSLDTIGILFGCCLSESITNDDFAGRVNFRIVETLCAGYEYYIKVGAKNDKTGSYMIKVTAQTLAEEVLIHPNRNDGIIVLEQGKTYELPLSEGYSFLNVANTEKVPLTVEVNPNSTADKRVYWYASSVPSNPVNTDFFWYNSTTRCQTITANSCGGTKLYAYDWFERGKTGEAYVAVIPNGGSLIKATGISLDHTSLTLDVGEYQKINANVSPSNATVQDAEWISDDPNIATVTPYGRVKAIAPGTTKIRAKSMTGTPVVESVCNITVLDPMADGTPLIVKCSGGLNVMSAATGGTLLGTFANGSTIYLVDETPLNETMFKVYGTMSNGTSTYGWCSGEYLQKEVTFLKSVCEDNINVRKSFSTNSEKIGKMQFGDHFPLLQENTETGSGYEWYNISYNGEAGYVYIDPLSNNYNVVNKYVLLAYRCNKISEPGITMLKTLEEYRSTAYKPFSYEALWTIGYGHLITDGGTAVEVNGVRYSTLTEELANILLRDDLTNIYEPRFNNFLQSNNIRLNQFQYDACIMDAYQKGQHIWQKGTREIVKFILADQDFENYDKVLAAFIDDATAAGLINRRTKEANLFVNNIYSYS